MKLPVVLREDENGYIVAHCPIFTGCKSEGKTEKEAIKRLRKKIMRNLISSKGIEHHNFSNVRIKEIKI